MNNKNLHNNGNSETVDSGTSQLQTKLWTPQEKRN